MAFFEVNVYNYQKDVSSKNASSPWKLCKISSNVKTKFQISRWIFFAYVMVLVSKKYGIPWRMCAKFFLSLKTMNSLRDTQYSPKTMELYSKMYIALLRSFWNNMHFPSCRRHYFGKHLLQKWWTRSIKKSAQLVHIE